MEQKPHVLICGAVKGAVDEAVLVRLAEEAGAGPGAVFGKKGKNHLLRSVNGYNRAAQFGPWLVLVDLDQDAECPPQAKARWLPRPAARMCFRIAVPEIESWLLADAESLSSFLSVPVSRIPADPETAQDPKAALVALALRSRKRDIKEDMVPRPGSGRSVGPAYASRLIEFSGRIWRPEAAARRSESLRRCRRRLRELVEAEEVA